MVYKLNTISNELLRPEMSGSLIPSREDWTQIEMAKNQNRDVMNYSR